ncbi:hypothetical protein [Mesorhizobium sp. B2-1-5]|uniref:hypothetical protein n=1 Tax=Mesorhizobium sp. B2-1-5 TaxID=2589969 RepID=UPI0011279EBC|nr:hypothetical protein [Mesorhizobium sp. B2-1-5]TPM94230.1 hypothetical protein FJ966_18360 [Mesorhizobium sp. B2-1-5]
MMLDAGPTARITVTSADEADLMLDRIRASALRARDWIASFEGDPLHMLRSMKFEPVGFHPVGQHPLNLVEQINQTWTFAVALVAAKQLLLLHPDAGGLRLAPGAHASQPLDIMSSTDGLVGAETFAAVTPRNNGKLANDLIKLAMRPEQHRYIFFMSPRFPGNSRRSEFERDGIQVWSVDL